jgi:hypothetical protein
MKEMLKKVHHDFPTEKWGKYKPKRYLKILQFKVGFFSADSRCKSRIVIVRSYTKR